MKICLGIISLYLCINLYKNCSVKGCFIEDTNNILRDCGKRGNGSTTFLNPRWKSEECMDN